MKAGELIEKLSSVSPDTEIITGIWNGRVETYAVLDQAEVFPFDSVCNYFYGTPGAFDKRLSNIRSKDVVYLGTLFEATDTQTASDRRFVNRLCAILRQHRSREWKKERVYRLLKEFESA